MNAPTSLKTRNRLLALAVASCFSAGAWALPVAPTVVGGSASFSQNGNVLNVKNSNGAIINWQSFSIGAGETTRFLQSSASSSVLNRVLAGDPSLIYGTLSSNGRVWLVNPAGILVGAGGRIDTAGFVASTLAVKNSDFLANKLTFGSGDVVPSGTVVNQGTITTPQGGSVYLVGAGVENDGLIQTPRGTTLLAAGKTVQLIDTATPGVKVELTGDGQSTNLGQVVADAGRIGLVGSLVKNSGTLNASSVVKDGGRVFLKASQDAYVDGDGRIVTTGVKGGRVEVLGDRVALAGNAAIDASGATGGGTVLVGGDYQGKNAQVQNAEVTYFGGNASVKADAIDSGNGGKVIFWADNTTRAYGSISARGGANSGNGGFVETSGKKYLDVYGISVNASALHGKAGTWLLDPSTITIAGGTGDGAADGTTTFQGSATPGTVNFADGGPTTIYQSELEGLSPGTNIVLEATDYINTSGSFSNLVTLPINSNLTMRTRNASTDISGTIGINLVGSVDSVNLEFKTQGSGTITLQSGTGTSPQAADINVGKLTTGGGSVSVNASGNVVIRGVLTTPASAGTGGDISLTSGGFMTLGGANINASGNASSAGNVTLISGGAVSVQSAKYVLGNNVSITATGGISNGGGGAANVISTNLTLNNAGSGDIRIIDSTGFAVAGISNSAGDVYLNAGGAVTQATGGANAITLTSGKKLHLDGSGSYVLDNTANAAQNLEAGQQTAPAPSAVTYYGSGALGLGSISTNAGNLTIKVTGAVTGTGNIYANGNAISADAGNVYIEGSSFNYHGNISADGYNPATFIDGGKGGSVHIVATATDIQMTDSLATGFGLVSAHGGNANVASGKNGGNGGGITLTATSGGAIHGFNLDAHAGAGDSAGLNGIAGTILLEAPSGNLTVGDISASSTAVNVQAPNGKLLSFGSSTGTDIAALGVNLAAKTGIGTTAAPLKVYSGTSTLSFGNTGSGDVNIGSDYTLNLAAGSDSGGNITVTSTGSIGNSSIQLFANQGNVQASGTVTYVADAFDINNIDPVNAANNVGGKTIASSVTIKPYTTSNNVFLDAYGGGVPSTFIDKAINYAFAPGTLLLTRRELKMFQTPILNIGSATGNTVSHIEINSSDPGAVETVLDLSANTGQTLNLFAPGGVNLYRPLITDGSINVTATTQISAAAAASINSISGAIALDAGSNPISFGPGANLSAGQYIKLNGSSIFISGASATAGTSFEASATAGDFYGGSITANGVIATGPNAGRSIAIIASGDVGLYGNNNGGSGQISIVADSVNAGGAYGGAFVLYGGSLNTTSTNHVFDSTGQRTGTAAIEISAADADIQSGSTFSRGAGGDIAFRVSGTAPTIGLGTVTGQDFTLDNTELSMITANLPNVGSASADGDRLLIGAGNPTSNSFTGTMKLGGVTLTGKRVALGAATIEDGGSGTFGIAAGGLALHATTIGAANSLSGGGLTVDVGSGLSAYGSTSVNINDIGSGTSTLNVHDLGGGTITLKAVRNILLQPKYAGQNIATPGALTITSTGGSVTGAAVTTANPLGSILRGGTINVTAATGIDLRGDNKFTGSGSNLVTLTTTAAGGNITADFNKTLKATEISINTAAGSAETIALSASNFVIDKANDAHGDNVALKTSGDIVFTGTTSGLGNAKSVSLDATGNILASGVTKAIDTSPYNGAITLKAASIGAPDPTDLTLAGSPLTFMAGTGTVTATANSGGINLMQTTGNLLTSRYVISNVGSGNHIHLQAASGNIVVDDLTGFNANTVDDGLLLRASGTIGGTAGIKAASLFTASYGGTVLNGANQVGSFQAVNAGSGNIELTNTASPLDIASIANTAGSVIVDNTGTTTTSGPVAASGDVSITAHSPLTIGSGGVSAGGNITLIAGPTAPTNFDNLTLNGLIATTSTNGLVTLTAADNLVQNANVSSGGAAIKLTATGGGITMASGATTTSNGGAVTLKAAGDVVLNKIDAGSGTITLAAGGAVSSVPGASPNLKASAAKISAASAALSTSVKVLDADIAGSFSITDAASGQTITDAPTDTTSSSSATNETIKSGVNEVTKEIANTASGDKNTSTPVEDILFSNIVTKTADGGYTSFIPTGHTLGGGSGEFGEGDPSAPKKDKDKDKDSNTNNNQNNNSNGSKPSGNLPKC